MTLFRSGFLSRPRAARRGARGPFALVGTLLLSWLIGLPAAHAQQVQWAAKVVSTTSQRTEKKTEPYAPEKLLGQPDALPEGEENKSAWSPEKEDAKKEVVEVKMSKSIICKQVVVVESFNPGSVTKIELVDTKNDRHTVYTNNNPGPLPDAFRVLSVKFDPGTFRTVGVVVTMNTAAVQGLQQLDAIGIADTHEPVTKRSLVIKKDIGFDTLMVNIGPCANTKYTEVRPMLSADGKVLYFARQESPDNMGGRDDGQDVWSCHLKDEKNQEWADAKNLGKPVNQQGPNGVASVSADGNSLLLINKYQPSGGVTPDGASVSTRTKSGSWSFPKPLNILDWYNKDKNQVDFYMANSGKTLLIAAERDGTVGGLDLYVSFLQQFGIWSKPLNIGTSINTKGEDFAPFLASDDKTLYFASDGRGGYGKTDIFMSKRLDSTWTRWSTPKNLGSNINSKSRDEYYTVSAQGKYAYLISDRTGVEKSRDIYRIQLEPEFRPEPVILVTGRVLDQNTQKPITARVRYESLVTGEELGTAVTNPEDGTYTIVLPAGVTYGYMAEADGYLAVDENLDATKINEYTIKQQDLYMVPFEVGQTIKLNNIFFEQSRHFLQKASYLELNRLAKLLRDYPTVEIILEGHTDGQGDAKLNLQLSVDRVNEVKRYLNSKGISKARIATIGYGGTRPIASNAEEETRKLNRRVEFKITKK
ncbi:MAG: PD40 domain-containing protein [Hymenobacteraceae bacterium]|nr:PD40 domain-containing protein [Hymenobacteraceae bacterium]